MMGKDANYVPGWDCHGLPIEWKVEEKYRKAKARTRTKCRSRSSAQECRDFAENGSACSATSSSAWAWWAIGTTLLLTMTLRPRRTIVARDLQIPDEWRRSTRLQARDVVGC